MTVVDLVAAIRREHEEVLQLAGDLASKYEKWPVPAHGTFKTLRGLVSLEARHEAAEARILWPVVRDALPQYAELRAAAEAQERQGRWQLHALLKSAGTDASAELVAKTVQAIRIHVGLEESQILPALQSSLSRNDLLRLGRLYQRASAQGPTRPHPRTPAIPGVLALVTPLARRTDRLKDLLRIR